MPSFFINFSPKSKIIKSFTNMKRNFTVFRMSFILLLGFFIVINANAQSTQNRKLSVQGYLKDGNGKAVDNGNYAITFKVYDVATGGTALWTEDNPTVNVYGGIYTVQLGAINDISLLAWDKPYFLGISISGTELSPRTELTYAPYAFAVNKATYVQCSGAVGDVKYSTLDPIKFATVNGDCWVPMDGRTITGSKLATLLGVTTITNAGGMFLRGQDFLNSDNDPDRTSTSAIATLQNQAFLAHNHSATADYAGSHNHSSNANGGLTGSLTNPNFGLAVLNSNGTTAANVDGIGDNQVNLTSIKELIINNGGNHTHNLSVNNNGGIETRPKNLNLWTYVRIN